MREKDLRVTPDYFGSYHASMQLVQTIRAYYAKLEAPVKVWIEEAVYPRADGKSVRTYSVRSNISFRVPD